MKKRLINDFYSFAIVIICLCTFTFGLIMGVRSALKNDIIIAVWIHILCWAFFVIVSVFVFILTYNRIVFCEDRIISRTFSKQVVIMYAEIISVQSIDKKGLGPTGMARVWRIEDSFGQEICVIRSPIRNHLIDNLLKNAQIGNHSK